jgi:hypothetical protein
VTVGTSMPGNGPVVATVHADGSYEYTYQVAYTQNGHIELNGNYFPDPTQLSIQIPGGTMSLLDAVNRALGTALDAVHFGTFAFLHELSHIANGTPPSALDTDSFNLDLIKKCL